MIPARWSAFAALLLVLAAPARADTLVVNVNGITLDERGQVQRFSALRFGQDGKVRELYQSAPGPKKGKRPAANYQVDGRGRTLLPGVVDSHVELIELGLAELVREQGGTTPDRAPRPIDRDAAFERAQKLLLAAGVTAVADMGTSIEEWQAFRRAGDIGRLKLRIMSYADGNPAMVLIGGPGPTPWLYDGRLKLNGVLLRLDAPGERGTALLTQTQLGNLMSRAAMDGFQVAVEAHANATFRSVLDAIDDLAPTYKGERRWRIEGADAVDPADLGRLRALGVVASVQPVLAHGQAGSAAWRSLAAAGAVLAFGSGAPAAPVSPFAAVAAAIGRGQEPLGRAKALAASTLGAAYGGGAEQQFGRLAPGLRADFILIDTDPLLADLARLDRARVLETWIGGERVFAADQRERPR